MPSSATLLLFSGAALTLLLIPGPAVLYIVAHSARHGRKAGLVSVAGIHTGTAVHIAAALVGLSALIVASATAFTVVKFAGAAYLIWMGARTLLETRRPDAVNDPNHAFMSDPSDPGSQTNEPHPTDLRRIYRDAVVVNVLNPKTAVFFLAYVPQFINPNAGHATSQLLALSGLFVVLGILSDGGYAFGSAWLARRSLRKTRTLRSPQRGRVAAGLTYIGLGAVTAFTGHSTA